MVSRVPLASFLLVLARQRVDEVDGFMISSSTFPSSITRAPSCVGSRTRPSRIAGSHTTTMASLLSTTSTGHTSSESSSLPDEPSVSRASTEQERVPACKTSSGRAAVSEVAPEAGRATQRGAMDVMDVVDPSLSAVDLDGGLNSEMCAPWGEFEDWLIQDTYSRYAIGSGKHVLWRRMVREVPELMDRYPAEVRERWLELTGRVKGEQTPGAPRLDNFYLQPPVLEGWEEVAEESSTVAFRGRVFGQKGLAEGAQVTTAGVDVTGKRIEDQYVVTQCGVVYELGEPKSAVAGAQESFGGLLKMSPVSALALSTAFYAFAVLSHHLQVEIFVV
ncbi:unnamed protein product [Discosporangium mesarthrocarpum]